MDRPRVVRDPIHDYVELPDALVQLVDNPLLQRLRRIRQNSLTLSVYPSATGTRFEHALGTMHLAMAVWDAVWRNTDESVRTTFTEELRGALPSLPHRRDQLVPFIRTAMGAVGLLHDVGHPPFSHALEDIFQEHELEFTVSASEIRESFAGPFHEFAGRFLVGFLDPNHEEKPGPILENVSDPVLRQLILHIYVADEDAGSPLGVLHSIVSGQYDVDRTDYLARDNQRIGTEFGEIDQSRLIDAFELHYSDGLPGFDIAPGIRGRSAVETLLTQRVQTYRWVLFHARVIGTNLALARSLSSAWYFADNDVGAFANLRPNFNYLHPTSSELRGAVSLLDVPENVDPQDVGSTQEQLFDESASIQLLDRLRERARGSVDDATVVEFLKRSVQIGELELERSELDGQTREEIYRLLSYVAAALFRSKNFLIVWKTDEDYADMASDLERPLVESLDEAYQQLSQDFSGEPGLQAHIDFLRTADIRMFDDHPVKGFNHVIKALLSDPQYLDRLESELHATKRDVLGAEGWWALRYNHFTALGSAVVVYRGDTRVDLVKRSPYLRALKSVEETAMTLYMYFFLRYPQSFQPWGSEQVRDARQELRRAFMEAFPRFVSSNWSEYVRRSVIELRGVNGE
jgi:HD superfamily phosphohydrolase